MTESCPTCHAPVRRGQARCEECQVSFEWFDGGVRPKHPFIRPGAPLLYFDLTASPLPGQLALHGATSDGTRFDATRDGALVSVVPKRALSCTERKLRARDACVRAAFVALDPAVQIGCVARIDKIDVQDIQYLFCVEPFSRKVELQRGFSGPKSTQFTDLVPPAPSPLVAPVGTLNVLELRVMGPTLEARLNEQHLMTVHDPVLGMGSFGLRVETLPAATGPQRVLVPWFEVREVIA